MLIITCIAVFGAVSAAVFLISQLVRGDSTSVVENRLANLTGGSTAKQAKEALLRDSVLSQPLEPGRGMVDRLVAHFNLRLMFEQADIAMSLQNFFVISVGCGVGGCVAGSFFQLNPVLTMLIALTMFALPLLWVSFCRKQRFKKFGKQLPDALELMARALRSGHSLAAGLSLVAEEMTNPIAKEFNRVFEESNLGIPIDEAMENMTERIPNIDLRFFATAVILQRQTGGDLAEILDKIGELIRERFKIFGQVQALTGEGRLSGIVLLALPPLLFLAVYRLNPDYISVLFTDPMGKKMLLGGLVMQLLGAVVIRKIINIKV